MYNDTNKLSYLLAWTLTINISDILRQTIVIKKHVYNDYQDFDL